MNYKILIVDDEAANLRLLERLFRREYQVVSATSGAEALELLKLHDVALIISDQRMPGMTGIEFLKRAAEMRQHTVRIILTGYTDVTSLVEAINSGVVYKYVTKPWVNEDLQQTVVRALEHYETIKSQYGLNASNERLTARLEATKKGFVGSIANTLDMKDAFLHGHLRRTSNYAAAIGYRFCLEPSELKQLSLAAFLHKVGRIGIDENLTSGAAGENQNVKSLYGRGVQMLMSVPDMEDIASAVRSHTEHFDGSGAPENLNGEQIPLFSRIISVASAYDEMTAPSSANQKILTHEEAVERLCADAGKKFDPRVVTEFCSLKSIIQIQDAINDDSTGTRLLLGSKTTLAAGDLPTAELLQKFKTEPLLAMEVVRLANASDKGERAARLLPLMATLGEPALRGLISEYGLPQEDEKTKTSIRRAVAAQLLAAHTDVVHPDEAYTIGLLYDVGETLLSDLFPVETRALDELEEDVRPRRQVEVFGFDAAQISQSMLEARGLPVYLTAAVNSPFEEMQLNTSIALLMYLADKIAKTQGSVKLIDIDTLRADALTTLNLSRADVKMINERANSITDEQINARQNIYATV